MTFQIATTQIDRATKHHFGHIITEYLSACRQYIRLSQPLPMHIKPTRPKQLESHQAEIMPNGVLRAHVVKAEACLQMAILYLLQEKVAGYIKCGLNLRRGIDKSAPLKENSCLFSICELQHCLARIQTSGTVTQRIHGRKYHLWHSIRVKTDKRHAK